MRDDKWTDRQLCPACGVRLRDCDWCEACDLELQCAQTPEGLAAATLIVDAHGRALVLAR